MQIIDGKKLSQEILGQIKKEVAELSFQPVFCDILVGSDLASVQYVRMKAKTAESLGIKFHNANFAESITTEELIKEIEKINKIENMCGLIIQLPLPAHIDQQAVLDAVEPEIDVDSLGTIASTKFYGGVSDISFPAALACIVLFDSLNLDLREKNIVVVGQGPLVGRPVTAILEARGLNPSAVTSQTPDKESIIKGADVLITGIGKPRQIKGEMVKPGTVIIDAGASELDGGVTGDVDLESVREVAGYVSPVPGGVGPMTVALLFKNVLTVAKKK
jgi:methylenetetrahydrofolate dehydrogenase (NADP+) / methenyltetrahydrofolate cyclohydrolase